MHQDSTPLRFIPQTCKQCGRGFIARSWYVRNTGGGKYCSPHCYHESQKVPVEDRFWTKVKKPSDPDGCWEWTGLRDRSGYGIVSVNRKQRRAAAVAWEMAHGEPIPSGLFACHHCDNPPCVRPDHIFPGTPLEDTADCIAKGRHAHGDDHWTRLHPERVGRGELGSAARLSREQVQSIRERYARGGITQDALAAEYGVRQSAISRIIHGKRWAHLD